MEEKTVNNGTKHKNKRETVVSIADSPNFGVVFLRFCGFCPPQARKFLNPLKLATHLTWPPGGKHSFPLKLAGQLKWVGTVQKILFFFKIFENLKKYFLNLQKYFLSMKKKVESFF